MNSNAKQGTNVLPELMINQPMDAKTEKYYQTSGTQTMLVEDHEETIADDMEIIPNNVLQDDFVQLDINECNEEQAKVNIHLLCSSMTISVLFQIVEQQ